MARKKTPVTIQATSAALWFCEDDHLHIEMCDHHGNPVAAIQLDLEDGMEVVADLVAELGFMLVDPDEADGADDDPIGPTMGNA